MYASAAVINCLITESLVQLKQLSQSNELDDGRILIDERQLARATINDVEQRLYYRSLGPLL